MLRSGDRIIGDYRIAEPLGRGGMATVYRGVHLATSDEVAIKAVHAPNERVVQSIRREVRALARLCHPGIVRIVDHGLDGGLPWYAMELIDGVTLAELGDRDTAGRSEAPGDGTRTLAEASAAKPRSSAPIPREPLGLDTLLTVSRALCAGLSYLHGEGLVHRDLKPSNIIVRAIDDPVIVDFGLTSQVRGRASREALEIRGGRAGTAPYMAPELIRGDPVDARADLYALGCILYELATGAKPFSAFTVDAVLRSHLEVIPPPPSQLVAAVPGALDDLVMRLLAKDPRDRIGHASDVGRVLEQLGARVPERPLPAARDYLYRPGFVGRHETMRTLLDQLSRARDGRGSLVLIGGESGIGKTRVINELGARASREGFTVVDGECSDAPGRPLEALLHPLQCLADRCRERGAEESARIFGSRAKILAPYLPALATLPGLEDHDEPAPLSPDGSRLRVLRNLADTLAAAATEAPLVLVLDDLHWADRLTLDLLEYLTRQGFEDTGLVVLGTYRREETPESLERLLGLAQTCRVDVDRLTAEDVSAMVSDMLAAPAPHALNVYVTEQSEGNPFFVAEYLRAAVEAGLLRRGPGGRWTLSADARPPPLELPLPSTLRELVQGRLDGLSEAAAELLTVAAVLGREIDVAVLIEASGLDEARAFDAIVELVRRHLLEETGDERVRFTHDKLREVVEDASAADARAALHRRAAEALEAHAGDAPPYDALARHWLAAGLIDRALNSLEAAGGRALERSAHRRAAECYRLALETAPATDRRRAEWERCLGEAALGLGDPTEGQSRLLRALELEGAPPVRGRRRLAVGLLAEIARQLGHRLLPRMAIAVGGDQAVLLRRTRAYQRLVEIYWFENDVPRMVEAGLRALNLAERAGPSPELARAYATLCLAVGCVPINGLAERYAALAVGTAEAAGDQSAQAYVLFVNSVYRVGTASWARVESDLERAAEISLDIGDSRFHGESLTVLAMAALYQGSFRAADELFIEVGDSGRRFDNVQHRLWSAIGRAETQLRLGDLTRAREQIDVAHALLDARPQAGELLRLCGLEAALHLARGELDAAARAMTRAERSAASLSVPTAHYLLEGYAGIAEVRLAQLREGGRATERRAAREAVRALHRFANSFPIGRPRARTLLGTLQWCEGRRRRAIRTWRAAARRADSIGMRHEATLARATEARHAR